MKKITMACIGGLLFLLCYQHTTRQSEYVKKQEKPVSSELPKDQAAAKISDEMRNSLIFKLVKA